MSVKERLQNMLLKVYGEDKGELDERLRGLNNRVEERRQARLSAEINHDRERHTGREYEDWMNFGEPND